MLLQKFLDRVKQRFLPVVTYDDTNGTQTRTWLGHTKVFDFEGYLVSDTYTDRGQTITKTYYPGTSPKSSRKGILNKKYTDEHGVSMDEVWYDLKGKKIAYTSIEQPGAMLLLNNDEAARITTREHFYQTIQPILDMVQTRTLLVNYDLQDMSQMLNQKITQMRTTAPLAKPIQKKEEPARVTPAQTIEVAQPVAEPAQPETPAKPKLTPEQRKDRWEEQLLKRMEKHDFLLAQKAKVEASTRMDPAKKAERLASIQNRLIQNEKAQHILNTRLRAFQMAQDRDILKQFKVEERSEYKQWQAEIKQANAEIKSGSLTPDQLAKRKAELKEMRAFKKQAFTDYRMATQGARRTITESKLKSTHRQKTIFDLNVIVREKMALETALATELDIFKHAEISDRLAVLTAQKRALLQAFTASQKKKKASAATTRVADLKIPRQPLLPAFQAKDSKEAS